MSKYTSRQSRIIEKLQIIGSGSVAFFKDSILLLNLEGFDTKHHLISHSMREIESSIREILTFIYPEKFNNPDCVALGEDQHLISINKCLNILRILDKDETAIFWKKLGKKKGDYNLAKNAHRDNLDYRRFSNDFLSYWNDFEQFLELVLDKLNLIYFKFISELDHLLSIENPGIAELYAVKKKLPKLGQFFHYFMVNCKSINWFETLYNSGHLSVSKDYIQANTDAYSFYWPPIQYLNSLVQKGKNDLVWKVISAIPDSDSSGFYSQITSLVNKLPIEFRIEWMQRLIPWVQLNADQEIPNSEPFRVLMRDLLDSRPSLVLDFMRYFFRLNQDTNKDNSVFAHPLVNSRLSKYEYFDSLQALISSFLKQDIPVRFQFFSFISDLMNQALTIEYPRTSNGEDRSYITRSSIMEDMQNYNHHVSDKLVSILRDVGKEICELNSKDYFKIQNILKSYNWILLQRMSLHFARVYGVELDWDNTKNLLLLEDGKYVRDISFRNEYFYLLKNVYPKLIDNEKENFLNELDRIAREEELRFQSHNSVNSNFQSSENFQLDFLKDSDYYKTLWPYLSAINDHLEGQWRIKYEQMEEIYNKDDRPPQYAAYHWSFVGPVSPVDRTEIANMRIEDLVDYLERYEPEDSIRGGHSREGLNRQIEQDVEKNPLRYLESYKLFMESKIHIKFHNGILSGVRNAISNKNLSNFNLVVDYLIKLHAKFEQTSEGRYSTNEVLTDPILGIYRTLYDQFDAFEKSERNKELIRNIFPYLEDSSPNDDFDTKNDPIHNSINSIRGETLHALFKCILWLTVENEQWNDVRFSEPIIETILEKVKTHFTQSVYKNFRTDRSVLGQYLRFIFQIKKAWFLDNIQWILPEDNKTIGNVTFYTYIQRGGFSETMYAFIKSWYIDLLNELPNLDLNNDEGNDIKPFSIAEHTMMIYGYSLESLEPGGLVDLFFFKAPDFLKGNAIRFLGTKIPKEDSFIQLAKSLWQWRVESGFICINELDEFLEWWQGDLFESDWIFSFVSLYKQKTEFSGSRLQIYKLFEILDKNFGLNPKLVIEILDSYTQSSQYYLIPRKEGNLWAILMKGLQSNDPELKTLTEDIINRLGYFGYLDYRELLGI
ncbi:MAG: hypothetical protein GW938_15845 [Leptospira sp.]|nr:hypothetical protein [Leptospira sp.]NCS94907.1 hypothetical protein [Leptospira sp.]